MNVDTKGKGKKEECRGEDQNGDKEDIKREEFDKGMQR